MAESLYQLVVRKGPKVGETFILDTLSVIAGRDPVSDIVLNDPEVSRQHARFTQTDSGYQVQDLGSTNGTFVNGQRLESDLVDLEPGFTISMGSGVTLRYEAVPTGDALAATMVDESMLGAPGLADGPEGDFADPAFPDLEDEPKIPSDWEPDPSPPFTPPPPLTTPLPPPASAPAEAAPPLVPPVDEEEAARKKRRNTIITITAVILLLCCCGFFLYMWFIGGDLLLEALGLL